MFCECHLHRINMDDDIVPPRFSGRTYSRTRQNKNTDDGSTVPVKAAVSLSKWGQTNYVPYREDADNAVDAKKPRMESRGEDPFNFDTEDKSKSPVKRHGKVERQAMLPASRIDTSGKSGAEQSDAKPEQPAFRTYSRTPKKDNVDDQFIKLGKIGINKEKDKILIAKPMAKEEEDDDIFPAVFKRDPLKTYAGEVVTPVDKPDSPPPKKGRYQKTNGQRGRKPLMVSDPGLIEQYKKNYEAQQQRGKTDTDTGGLNNSMVVSKQELANEEQGTTVVVVCKPKSQVDKGEVSAKYFSRTPRKQGLTVLDVASESSQETSQAGENGKSANSSPEGSLLRMKNRRIGNQTPVSIDSSSPNSQTSPVIKRLTRARSSNADWSSPGTDSNVDNSQSEGSGSRAGKRYRIFKSRTQVTDTKEGEASETERLHSQSEKISEVDGNQCTPDSNFTSQPAKEGEMENEDPIGPQIKMEEPKQEIYQETPDEPSSVSEEGPVVREIDPVSARHSLAARLKNLEKGADSDSTEHDNGSECSEPVLSQESPANSQQSTEEKEDVVVAPRRFFKSKKSLSGSSDLQKKIFGSSPQKVICPFLFFFLSIFK